MNRAPPGSPADSWSIPEPFLHMRCAVIALIDSDGRVSRCSRGFKRILGAPAAGDNSVDVRDLFVLPRFDELLALPSGVAAVPVFEGLLTLGGMTIPNRSIRGAVYRAGDQLLLVGEHDIDDLERLSGTVLQLNEELAEVERELVRKNRQLELLSQTDPLTGLANRRELERRLQLEHERCQRLERPLSVIMVDIDLFKRVNDTHGHAIGDEVLQHVAELLELNRRHYDMVARYGGEEFVVLLPETPLETAAAVAERIRVHLAEAQIQPLSQSVTASFGVAEMRQDQPDNTLLARADQALYRAKHGGRNRVVKLD